MEDKNGYRVRICAVVDSEGNYRFKDEFFEHYEGALLLYSFLTLDSIKDALNASITPAKAYVSLNVLNADGVIIESKQNKHRLLQRI